MTEFHFWILAGAVVLALLLQVLALLRAGGGGAADALARMERSGLVARAQHEHDKRANRVKPTATGRRFENHGETDLRGDGDGFFSALQNAC